MTIPVLIVRAATLAQAHESALKELWKNGIRIKTQYDGDNAPSIDATMNITVDEPLADPMIHKVFPGGIEDLQEYVLELKGYKDHWTKNMNDPDDTRWEYTYHQRFVEWGTYYEFDGTKIVRIGNPVDQVDIVARKLAEQPYSRQAQLTTWMPFMDNDIYDPPCIQSVWYRITENITKDYRREWYIHTNVRIRSNDAFGAAFMNMFGITMFTRDVVIPKIQSYMETPCDIYMNRLNWQADSYHIYGKDLKDFQKRFMNKVGKVPQENRFYNFYDPDIQEIYSEAHDKVLKKIEKYDQTHQRN